MNKKIAFIGAGNMAGAIVAGLVKQGYPAHLITVTAPSETRRLPLAKDYGVNHTADNRHAVYNADIIILAVKPQLMAQVVGEFNDIDLTKKLVLSLAAGIQVSRLFTMLNQTMPLIRVMPNTPSLVGQGVSGLFAHLDVSPQDRETAEKLLSCVGMVCWVQQEENINDVIAVTGSSPAYAFLFMQAMQQKAQQLGFDETQSRELVLQALQGSVALAKASPHLSFEQLRENVTSKGGATFEAIRVFNENNMIDTVSDAMQAAINRAKEMENLF